MQVRDGLIVRRRRSESDPLARRCRPGDGVTALAVFGAIALVLLAPLVWAALRQRGLVAMAVRNIGRRRAEAVLVVAGALLGTAIITSSLVVGDVIEGSFADEARTGYGPVDVTLTPARGSDVGDVVATIDGARIDGIDGLLPVTFGTVTLEAPGRHARCRASTSWSSTWTPPARFGADPRDHGAGGRARPGARGGHPQRADRRGSRSRDRRARAAARVRILRRGRPSPTSSPEVGLAGYGDAVVVPGTIAALADASSLPAAAPPEERVLVSLEGGVFDTRAVSDRVVADLSVALEGTSGVEIEATKAAVLDEAERLGGGLTELFSTIGLFSVIAGILLLDQPVRDARGGAQDRARDAPRGRVQPPPSHSGVRDRGRDLRVVASLLGAVVGVGVGWLVAVVAGSVFGSDEQGSSYPLVDRAPQPRDRRRDGAGDRAGHDLGDQHPDRAAQHHPRDPRSARAQGRARAHPDAGPRGRRDARRRGAGLRRRRRGARDPAAAGRPDRRVLRRSAPAPSPARARRAPAGRGRRPRVGSARLPAVPRRR